MAKVTVLMPTYNVAPYVREAIDSVLRQTYRDFELLVIDDCSTDNTVEVVRSIEDPRIRIVQNEKNVGLAENLNRGLALVETEYVARMDGDDISEPFWLEREVAILDSHPEIGVCGGGGIRFGAMESEIRFPEEHDDIAANMLYECTIIVPTFRMSLVRDHDLRYRTEAFPAEDYRFWVDMAMYTRLHNIAEPLFLYRMHATQICTARREEQQRKVTEVRQLMKQRIADGSICVSHKAIQKRQKLLQRQERYYTIVDHYFKDGYSLPRYLRYLTSGLALRTGRKYETKFLLKSLLRRKA